MEEKKPSKLRDDHHDPMVGCMVQNKEMATQWLRLLKIETQHKTAPKSLQLGLREFRRSGYSQKFFKGPLNVLTSRTYRRPSEDSQRINTKIYDLLKKNFLEALVFVLHVSVSTRRANIQKF